MAFVAVIIKVSQSNPSFIVFELIQSFKSRGGGTSSNNS